MTDYTVGDTLYIAFTTRAFATGVPTVLAGTPVVSAYEDDGLTQITAGITLGVSHDSVVGMNMLTIVATGGNGYESGKDYNLAITTGTVGGVSVVGEIVGRFTLGRSAAAVDLANGTDGLGALKTGIDGVPTTAEFEARTILAASYFDPAADAVATVTTLTNKTGFSLAADQSAVTIGTVTTNTDMRGTDSALLAANTPTNFADMSISITTGLVDITQTAADKVWSTAARILTAGTNIVLAKGIGVTGFNDLSAAQVNAEVDTGLADYDGPTNAEMEVRTLPAAEIAQLTQNLDNCATGTASGTPTTTTMVSDLGVTVDDQFNGRIITFDDDTTTAALRKQSTDITLCTAASNTLTFTALTTAPVSGETFTIT